MELDGLQSDHQAGEQEKPEPSVLDPGVGIHDPVGGG